MPGRAVRTKLRAKRLLSCVPAPHRATGLTKPYLLFTSTEAAFVIVAAGNDPGRKWLAKDFGGPEVLVQVDIDVPEPD